MWLAVGIVVLALCSLHCQARVRTFYIAAVEVDWNYAPLGNLVNDDTQTSDKFLTQGRDRIGRVYRKILYREFTDSTFSRQAGSSPVLGLLGPTLRAETGDTIEVIFKNLATRANRSLSVHPHGVQYDKASEGALYVDQTTGSDKADDGVPPGGLFHYVWRVSPSFAPTADDEPCLPWVYHSHVSTTRDVDSGLVGLLLTCKKGSLRKRGRNKGLRKDVSEEYPIYVDTADENASWLMEHNLYHCRDHARCTALHTARDQAFMASNKMSHINGRCYGNLAGLEVARWGRPAVFYFFSVNRGMTGVHLSGQVFTVRSHNKDSISVYPATFVSATLTPSSLGHWLMASTNVDSYNGGQQAFVRVVRWTSFPWERKRRHAAAALMGVNSTGQARIGLNLGQGLLEQIAGQGLQELISGQGQQGLTSGLQNLQELQNVLSNPQIQNLLSNPGLQNLLSNPQLQNILSNQDFQNLLSNPNLQNVLSNEALQNFLSNQGLQDMLTPDGLQALLSSLGLEGVMGTQQPSRPARRYYLAVEDVVWDYAPYQQDMFSGGPLNVSWAALFFTQGPHTIGGRYKKTRFVQYTDSTYTTRRPRPEAEVHLGIMGPLLMAEVGETVEVHLHNMATRPYSFFPRGVHFDKEHEGFVYKNPSTSRMEGRMVQPGECKKYRFKVPALGRDDLPCVTLSYHSAVNPPKDVHTGLFGPMLICRRGQLGENPQLPWYTHAPDDRPNGWRWFQTHQHFFLGVFTLDENLSWHLQHNIRTYTTDPQGVLFDFNFWLSNRRHGINGLMFANLDGLTSCRGDPVAWHLLGLGGDFDVHGVIFHGQTLEIQGNTVNAKIVSPGTAVTLLSTPDTVGNWSVACRSNMHLLTGMTTIHEVKDCGRPQPQVPSGSGVIRRYYISAEEVLWDYAPLKRDLITGLNFTEDDSQHGNLYVKDTDEFIGTVYKKVRYLEYTDSTFCKRKPRLPHHQHLGILGPVIEAEVGDTIQVVFYNNASRSYSMHPQGVQYDKHSEGAMYQDGLTSLPGKAVLPGHKFTYTWKVPERSGPGPNDPACVAWMYYSSVNSAMDMSSGLVGPLLVCEPNTLTRTSPTVPGTARFDVDRQFWMLYNIFDENISWYLMDNIRERAPRRTSPRDPVFMESNLMNAINGLVYGNVQGMVMREGDVVSWYLLGLGSSNDFHPVHFHGQTFTQHWQRVHRGDVVEVFPSTSAVVEMVCDNPGTWIVHCHLANHVASGMEATFTILPDTAAP
ncbi:hypothetical protein ACOMHN_048894 [Nucella lapillus]